METCPTVRIKSAVEGIEFFVINEADFDPNKHERFDAAEKPAEPAEAPKRGRKAAAEKSAE